jgi:hypothetical protein
MYSFKHNQQDATLYNILYCWQCSICFRRIFRPSSGAQTVHTASGICQACLLLPLAWVSWQLTHASGSSKQAWHTWFVPKVSVLIFYLNIYWTHLKLQVISFKVRPLGSYTVFPTFFPLIIVVQEVIFRKCVCSSSVTFFLYVFHRPKMMSLQLQFQLREEVEIARS